jgi:hypothetical protein
MQVDLQWLTEDTETEISELPWTGHEDLEKRLAPELKQILDENHLGLILDVPNPVVVSAHPSFDVTAKANKLLDQSPNPDKQ